MPDRIGKAIAALRAGDDPKALGELLACWRTTRDAGVADAIDRIGQRIDAKRARPASTTVANRQAAWFGIASREDAADVGVLLTTLAEIKKAEPLGERIAALASRPKDPRIAMQLARMVGEWPIPGSTGIASLEDALELIVEIADPRTLAELERIAAVDYTSGHMTQWYLRRNLAAHIERLRARTRKRAEPPDLGALLAALGGPVAHTAASEPELFAAVYAKPDDDEPRHVIADYLQQRGDPRGELIALQLAGKRTRREAELWRTYARDWLGAIEPAVLKTGLTFERGFVARCQVREPAGVKKEIRDAREWATVTEITVAGWKELVFGIDERMPALRRIHGLDSFVPSHPKIEHATLAKLYPRDVRSIAAARAPALRTLVVEKSFVHEPDELAPLWTSRLGQALDTISLDVLRIPDWIPAMLAQRAPRGPLRVVELSGRGGSPWRLRFEADRVTAKYIWSHSDPGAFLDELAELFEGLKPPLAVELAEALGEPTPRLRKAIARLTRGV